jgi:hypothetical protein
MTGADRVREHRRRQKIGQRPIRLIVKPDEIDFLLARGYRIDNRSIAEAVSAHLADSASRAYERPTLIAFVRK